MKNSRLLQSHLTTYIILFNKLTLQEEIQKLAGQIQYLKIVGMLTENRHIKPKKDGYFSKETCSKQFHQFLQRVRIFVYICCIVKSLRLFTTFVYKVCLHSLFKKIVYNIWLHSFVYAF